MGMKFANQASTTLAGAVASTDTLLSVASSARFPALAAGDYFYATIVNATSPTIWEIIKVTAWSGTTFSTIVRNIDSSTGLAQSWAAGDKIEIRLTAATLNDMPKLDEANTFAVGQTIPGYAPLASPTFTGTVTLPTITPANSLEAAAKGYVDSVVQGLRVKGSVKAATLANITLLGTQTVDSIILAVNDKVLVKNQTLPAENGIYTVQTGAWTRDVSMDTWAEVIGGHVFVENNGSTQAGSQWVANVTAGGTINVTAINFYEFAGPQSFTGGTGITVGVNGQISWTATGATITTAIGATAVLNATNAAVADSLNALNSYTIAGLNLYSATGARITGDFSNATLTSRVMFQTSTALAASGVGVIPTSPSSASGTFSAFGHSDALNSPVLNITCQNNTAGFCAVDATKTGTATYNPLIFLTGGSERVRIDTTGNVSVGTAQAVGGKLSVYDASVSTFTVLGDSTVSNTTARYSTDTSGVSLILRKSRGTTAIPAAVTTGDQIGAINWQVFGGTSTYNIAQINATVGTYTADNNHSSIITFSTRPVGAGATLVERMRIDDAGAVGVSGSLSSPLIQATGTTAALLFVDRTTTTNNWSWYSTGNIARLYSGIVGAVGDKFTFDSTGNFVATANVTAYSDERLKTNWSNLSSDFVSKLARVKSGTFDRTDTNIRQVGVSAQSLQLVIPEAIHENEDGMLSVSYGNAALAAAVELAKVVEELRERIALLENR